MLLKYRIPLTTPHFYLLKKQKNSPHHPKSWSDFSRLNKNSPNRPICTITAPNLQPHYGIVQTERYRHRLGRTLQPLSGLDHAVNTQAEPQLHRTLLLRRFKRCSSTDKSLSLGLSLTLSLPYPSRLILYGFKKAFSNDSHLFLLFCLSKAGNVIFVLLFFKLVWVIRVFRGFLCHFCKSIICGCRFFLGGKKMLNVMLEQDMIENENILAI